MRIVVVTTSFPRSDEDPSGHFVRSSARALARAGHEVHVVAPGGSLLDPPARHGDLVVQIDVETPTRLSNRQKELLEMFRETETGDECPASQGFFAKLKGVFAGE